MLVPSLGALPSVGGGMAASLFSACEGVMVALCDAGGGTTASLPGVGGGVASQPAFRPASWLGAH